MVLKRITIQSFGALEYFDYKLDKILNVVKSRYADEIAQAMCLVLCNKYPLSPEYRARGDTAIEALIRINEKEFFVIIKNESGNLCLHAYDQDGIDITKEYLYLTSHCLEQDLSDVFFGDSDKTSFRLLQYFDEDRYYPTKELSKRTDLMSETKAFRTYLKSFIKGVLPEQIRDGKRYELYLDSQGKYFVRYKDDYDMPVLLSESEQTLFRYLCFLKTSEFWHGFEELRNLHGIKKPLLVKGFLERLDEAIDVSELLQRTVKLERQIIILSQ